VDCQQKNRRETRTETAEIEIDASLKKKRGKKQRQYDFRTQEVNISRLRSPDQLLNRNVEKIDTEATNYQSNGVRNPKAVGDESDD